MLEVVIFGALCVLGLYAAMGEGMIFEGVKHFFERITNNKVLRWIRPALYECPICMASIWGTVVWVIVCLHHKDKQMFDAAWVLYVFAVAGFNYVMVNIIDND